MSGNLDDQDDERILPSISNKDNEDDEDDINGEIEPSDPYHTADGLYEEDEDDEDDEEAEDDDDDEDGYDPDGLL